MSTPNGYDPHWIAAINGVLSDRDSGVRITDLNDELWERFIGPMCDAIEDGYVLTAERAPTAADLGIDTSKDGWLAEYDRAVHSG